MNAPTTAIDAFAPAPAPATDSASLHAMAALPTLADIEAAAQVVYADFAPTPQYRWALLSERLGTECWLKHENHTPVGAFKIRGGLTYFDQLARRGALPREVVSATRGNHGQSMGWAARRHGVACTIVVPRGNSVEKNAAMRALGVTLIEHGDDFQEAREHAIQLAADRGAHMVPSFHADLLRGVATYWWEFLRAVPQLAVAYVPIGQGSGRARPSRPSARWATACASSAWSAPMPPRMPTPSPPATWSRRPSPRSWRTAWPAAWPTRPRSPSWRRTWTTW